ncbi:FAD-dependent oxidoreductase [Chloroflexota bacterium]
MVQMMADNRQADVIVIGAGATGLMAAISAADEGANVLHFEKTSKVGGTFWIAGGTSTGAATKMQFEAGIFEDSPAVFYSDCMKELRARQVCESENLMFFCQNSGYAIDWLDSLGAYQGKERSPQLPIYGEPWIYPRSYFSTTKKYLNIIRSEHQKRIDRGDIMLKLNTEVADLVNEGRRVVEVKVGEKHYRAGAVILTTGGYSGNIELMIKHKFPQAKKVLSAGLPDATGDGLKWCQHLDAKLVNMDQQQLPYFGQIEDADNPGQAITHLDVNKYPGAIWVDNNGQRVTREDAGAYISSTRIALIKAPDMMLSVIIDDKIKRENDSILVKWYGGAEPRSWKWFEEKANEGIIIKKAETIEGLGRLLEINPKNFTDTVTKYNGYVAAGKDTDFGREELVYKIENPPFYGARSVPVQLTSSGGPATNIEMQVLDSSNKIIPGLYAAGEITAYRAIGTGGLNIGCLVYGRQAGKMAARDVFRLR